MPYFVAIAIIVTLAGCGGSHTPSSSPAAPPQRFTLPVEVLRSSLSPLSAQASGLIESQTRAVIAAQIPGRIRQVHVEIGQTVQPGQSLVTLDSQQLDASASQAEAARLEAANALEESAALIASARAQLQLAQSTESRLRQLFSRQSLSAQEMDEASARLSQAQSQLTAADARKSQAQSRLRQSEHALASARAQRSYTLLTAPFSGIVTSKPAQPGSLALPGSPLLTIERSGALRAALNVDESQASSLRLGTPLTLFLDGLPPISSRVAEIVPALDPASRTLVVHAALAQSSGLRSGQFVRAEWTTGQRQILSLPASSVRESGQIQLVFVLDHGIARSRMVSLGPILDGRREVFSGLSPGDSVLASLPPSLTDGSLVEAK
jgi:RND family efflux transporter MFP subunit